MVLRPHEYPHDPVVGIEGEGLQTLRLGGGEVLYFEGVGFYGPGESAWLVFNFGHAVDCFWLFYGKNTFEIVGGKFVVVEASEDVLG
jgi:hypothetical protein